jgi:hypothetical protein
MSRVQCCLLEDTGEWRGYPDNPGVKWRVFRDVATGRETSLHDAAPGAMFRSELYRGNAVSQDDGLPLAVKLPGGVLWIIDSCASDCEYARLAASERPKGHTCWTRTGVPPVVTATPSIRVHNYHGWLQDGWLEDA